jgi:hypothetical protein
VKFSALLLAAGCSSGAFDLTVEVAVEPTIEVGEIGVLRYTLASDSLSVVIWEATTDVGEFLGRSVVLDDLYALE